MMPHLLNAILRRFVTRFTLRLPGSLIVVFLGLFVQVPAVNAQNRAASSSELTGAKGLGGQILLQNSGLGIGGYISRLVNQDIIFVAEISLSSIKDGREVAFFNRLGQKDIPDKAHYVTQLPIQVGFEHRLFRASIEDNFRPFLHATTGPTLIWKSPYFDDINGNQELDPGEPVYSTFGSLSHGNLELGWSGTISVGAHFGKLLGGTQSLRLGYTFTYFFDEIPLLEPSVRSPATFVGSPSIKISFGKLY